MVAKYSKFHLILAVLLHNVAATLCLPNIRIQVNNENLKSPPYLLQAIKEAEIAQNGSVQPNNVHRVVDNVALTAQSASNAAANVSDTFADVSRNSSYPRPNNRTHEEDAFEDDGSSGGHSFSVVKEETIEEILDIDPESVLKLSPENLINEIAASEYSHSINTDMAASETSSQLNSAIRSTDGQQQQQQSSGSSYVPVKHDKKPQLPVTNSHLKKPAGSMVDDDAVPINKSYEGGPTTLGGGAKSLISPTIAAEEPSASGQPASNEMLRKSIVRPSQDTLDPSQVMNGVTNASLVPATITKDYGHHTRTRITLGGGYVRDKSPPLVNPASDAYEDNKPEKPIVPLERPHVNEPNGPVEESRIIETPERIVLPASVFKQNPDQQIVAIITTTKLNQNITKVKYDSRCPRRGVMTLEHPTACDKYYYCEDGVISEQVCPNGLLYGTRDMVKDYCVHRWKVVCGEKSIPNPISSPGCRWQYGVFNVQGSPRCSPDFYECVDGVFSVKKCSIENQVYDDRTKSCQFAEAVDCQTEVLAEFKCPPDDQSNTYWPFPRYFLNERSLIHCINDKPEIVRCTENERVDPEHLHCVPVSKFAPQSSDSETLTARRREKKKTKDVPA